MMIYIIDFDHTLCNTTALKEALQEGVSKFGVDEQIFAATYNRTVETIPDEYDYDTSRHAEIISKETSGDPKEIKNKLDSIIGRMDEFLFKDSLSFLNWLKDYGKIVILTWGNPKWQQTKIENSSIKKLADQCLYTGKEKSTLQLGFPEPEEEWVFINDNPKEIKQTMKLFPKSTHLRMKRPEGKKFDPEIDQLNVPTFTELAVLKKYLQKNNKKNATIRVT
ncbi:hypothetical protein KJ705_03975 [Patescibacteria group bacterium]|nr:hypothetical protein [Patescibacteria group bacterium]